MVALNWTNPSAIARHVVEIFFPQRPDLKLDQRAYSPSAIDRIVSINAEVKSGGKAKKLVEKSCEICVSVPTIMDLTATIGDELYDHLQQQASAHAAKTLTPSHPEAPNVAAVSVDGGRIMTRAKAGRGVHDQAWKETKNACLLTMSSSPSEEDPHPELPTCFANRSYVETLVREVHAARTGTIDVEIVKNTEENRCIEKSLEAEHDPPIHTDQRKRKQNDWRPKRLVRTCLSSMLSSNPFGLVVAGEAQRRGFYDAPAQAFLGDGAACNWTLHRTYFPDFVPIADFVHPMGYVYDAAKAISPQDPWPKYLTAITACWQGRVSDVLRELREWQALHPSPPDGSLPDNDPRSIVQRAVTYLNNNRNRMDYPAYRKAGLPTSTSMIESLIKEVNHRVKGTEKFWNRLDGAEHILQVRAASLCDDDRLSQWILNRPGSAYYRKSTAKSKTTASIAQAA